MPIYDVSLAISPDLPTWPGDPDLRLERVADLDRGDEATLTKLECCVHLGTHFDAPAHVVRGGRGIDALDLNVLMGPCWVAHVPDAGVIDATRFDRLSVPIGATRLLIRTRNSDLWARGETTFQRNFVAITPSGAEWLVTRGVRLIGVDYLSVGSLEDGLLTHEILLGAGLILIEGLNLSGIAAGEYHLIALPLKLKDADGAPGRVVLIGHT
jgi:arylformamidase